MSLRSTFDFAVRRSWMLLPSAAAGAGAGYAAAGFSPVMAGGAAIGLAPAMAAGLGLELRGHKLRHAEDIERFHDLETLGTIGRFQQSPGSAFPSDEHPEALQAYKELAATLRVRGGAHGLRTILVTSPGPEEGKSTTAANLATVLAQTGSKVILVDADLRWSSLRSTNANASSLGLTGLLLNYLHTPQLAVVRTNESNLYLLPAGNLPENPKELLALPRLGDVIASLREMADYVILDSPPLLEAEDARLLARNVDATLLVTLAGKTRTREVNRALRLLTEVDAQPLGAVLNRVKLPQGAFAPRVAPATRPVVTPETVQGPVQPAASQPAPASVPFTASQPPARPEPGYEPFSVAAFRKGPPRPIGANEPRPYVPPEEPAILRLAKEGLDARPEPAAAGAETESLSQAQRMAALRNLRVVSPDERPALPTPDASTPVPTASLASPPPGALAPSAPSREPAGVAAPIGETASPSVDEVLAHMEETLRLIREMRREKAGGEAVRL